MSHLIITRTGHSCVTRPAAGADHQAANALHARCSLDSLFARYQASRRELSEAEWHRLIRPESGLSWVTHPADRPHLLVAVTHVLRTGDTHVGELGLLVEDPWQNQGLGGALAHYAVAQAPALDLRAITVMTGRNNRRMLMICRALGAHTPRADGATIDLTLPVT